MENKGMGNENSIGGSSQIQRKGWKRPIITRIEMKRTMAGATSTGDGTSMMV